MNAIRVLRAQHQEVARLFDEIERCDDEADRQAYFESLADALAIHCAVEERHFYPAVRARRTQEILPEALAEHVTIKRLLADLVIMADASDIGFDAKLAVLEEMVEHHVDEEHTDLFPQVERIFDDDELEALGQAMQATASELEGTSPRYMVPQRADRAPSLR